MASETRSSQGSQHAAHSADDGWITEEKVVVEECVRGLVTKMDCGFLRGQGSFTQTHGPALSGKLMLQAAAPFTLIRFDLVAGCIAHEPLALPITSPRGKATRIAV